jgi:hydroxymethylpyrimidine/phosphomethylpyrimidine kinase
MSKARPVVISVAGFDPSGGAGLAADLKTFEAHKVLGMGVATSFTIQNEEQFEEIKWLETDFILRQISVLKKRHPVEFVKIGLVKNIEMLENIVDYLCTETTSVKIIWDPVIRSSSGFDIIEEPEKLNEGKILKKLFLITPNVNEAKMISGNEDEMSGAEQISEHCNVFLKGGHSNKKPGRDYLFTGKKQYSFRAKKWAEYPKHGSGCVLSSSIAAHVAKGFKLHEACLKGKSYTETFLHSNKEKLGYHNV